MFTAEAAEAQGSAPRRHRAAGAVWRTALQLLKGSCGIAGCYATARTGRVSGDAFAIALQLRAVDAAAPVHYVAGEPDGRHARQQRGGILGTRPVQPSQTALRAQVVEMAVEVLRRFVPFALDLVEIDALQPHRGDVAVDQRGGVDRIAAARRAAKTQAHPVRRAATVAGFAAGHAGRLTHEFAWIGSRALGCVRTRFVPRSAPVATPGTRRAGEGGVPTGIRTPVIAVKGRCPRPLDDGDMKTGSSSLPVLVQAYRVVEVSGIEPLTSCMPCKRSPS